MSNVQHTAADGAPSATQRAYLALRRLIITGEIEPGSKLKVEALKVRLDVGASPLREALSLLTSDQLVERIDQRGFRASQVGEAQFQEILMLRCQLEDIALRASMEATTFEQEEILVLAHHRMSYTPRNSADMFEVQHKAFHMALLSGCGSPILLRFCEQLYDLNIRYRYLAARSGNYGSRDVAAEHEGILKAVLARDADRASSLLREHYARTGAFLAGFFG